MPICEADPWRLQYFEHVLCAPDERIPTEDADAWSWYPDYRFAPGGFRLAIVNARNLAAGLAGRELLRTHFLALAA